MEYKVEGLNDLAKNLHEFVINAGFTDYSIPQRLIMVHSEISEAFEAFRKDKYANLARFERWIKKSMKEIYPEWEDDMFNILFEQDIKDSFEDEMADSIIRLLAMCAENNIDIEKHINYKMKYNELRGLKYGGKKF